MLQLRHILTNLLKAYCTQTVIRHNYFLQLTRDKIVHGKKFLQVLLKLHVTEFSCTQIKVDLQYTITKYG